MNEDKCIGVVSHYVPLHDSPMGIKLGREAGLMSITRKIASQIVRLPLHLMLTKDDQERVVHSAINISKEMING